MKKTIGILIMLIVVLFALTGCAQINYEVKVNKDGSGEVSYIYGFTKETLNSLQVSVEDMVANMKEQAEKSEYQTEYYEDDEISGFKASKHLNDLSKEFSLSEAFGEEYVADKDNNGIVTNKSLFKTVVSQDVEIDLTSMADVASAVKLKYTVKLPVAAKTNNATEVTNGNKTLTWDLVGGELNTVEFTASGYNYSTIILFAICLLVLIACIVYLIVFLKNKKETK